MLWKFIKHEIAALRKFFGKIAIFLLSLYSMAFSMSLFAIAILIPIAYLFGGISVWVVRLEILVLIGFFLVKRYKKYVEKEKKKV